MPNIDNFLFGNYGLGGPSNGAYKVFIPNVPGTSQTVSAGTNPKLATIATFDSGTNFIGIMTSGNTSPCPFFYSSTTFMFVSLGLEDSNGLISQVTPNVSQVTFNHILHVQIDLEGRKIASQTRAESSALNANQAVSWSLFEFPIPTNFNISGPLSLVVYVQDNSSGSSATARWRFQQFRITSR
ncbi:hypothetical protein KQI74_28295 [Paenibacillus barcinonensis]|uniref:hypothetical protein n=1 Tax=Paenibacillus barcinonensis TaxID=198119 RepID=UPI001C126DB9|nr:hypothetical protein [Paenibacillus barcinonensis]MBU5356156.1 hypothetical protein [Paenibacillus barcinonensis]